MANPAAEDTKTLLLVNLNKRSARFGTWKVFVYYAKVEEYEYQWDGKPRSSKNLNCLLVDESDHSSYCNAQFKLTKQNMKEFEQAKKKFTNGARLICTKIAFLDHAKKMYLNAPVKLMVDLANTHSELVRALVNSSSSAAQPWPEHTISELVTLTESQCFDITGLILSVSEKRPVQPTRAVFDVELIDGSTDESTGRPRTMKLTLFSEERDIVDLMREAQKAQEANLPISIFNILGSKNKDDEYSITSSRSWHMVAAVGTKAQMLSENAATIQAAPEPLQFNTSTYSGSITSRDYTEDPATETSVQALCEFAQKQTGVAMMDNIETLWQVNRVQLSEPPTDSSIKTKDGKRLFFITQIRDFTKQMSLPMTEQAALRLTKMRDAEAFEAAHTDGRLWFPTLCAVKVLRRRSKENSAAQPVDDRQFDCIIVDATEQNMLEGPSAESMKLLPMLDAASNEIILPASLDIVKHSPHYTTVVQYVQQQIPMELSCLHPVSKPGSKIVRPCSQVIALVAATGESQLLDAGTDGFMLVNDTVRDLTEMSGEAYEVTSYCSLRNLQDFKLDPPRTAKQQAALVVLSDALPSGTDAVLNRFVLESVQLLSPSEAERILPVFKQFIYFASLATQISQGEKRKVEWTEEDNPSTAKKCKTLGRSPTGDELPLYSTPSPAKRLKLDDN